MKLINIFRGPSYYVLQQESKREVDKEFSEWLKNSSKFFIIGFIMGFILCLLLNI